MKKYWLLPLVIIMIIGLVVSGCGKATTETPTSSPPPATTGTQPPAQTTPSGPQSGGIMKIVDIEFITGPFGYTPEIGANAYPFIMPCIEPFFHIDIEGNPIPLLAESWEFSNDYKSTTFHLRKGVKFHDGSDFNAEVAKWNMQLRWDNKDMGTEVWDSIDVLDDHTLRLNFTQFVSTAFVQIESLTYMISKEAFDKNGLDWVRYNLVSTGPFKLKEYKSNESIEYERNDDYWGGKTYLDGIKFTVIPDPVTASLALQSGQANVLHEMGGANQAGYELEPKGYHLVFPTCIFTTLAPDSKNSASPLSNLKVREAVEYAIDKKAICQKVGYGYWNPLNQPAYTWQTGYVPDLQGRDYDPAKAKELLNEAGYPNGFKTTIHCPSPIAGDHLASIKAYLADVGIDADLDIITFGAMMSMQQTGWDGFMYSPMGGSTIDSSSYINMMFNPASFQSSSIEKPAGAEELRQEILAEPDNAKRAQLCQQATQLMVDNEFVIPLWEAPAIYAMDNTIHDDGILNWQLPFIWDWTKVWMSK
jgi:peptide/nickel transport system substrate-binding protein